jgi:hypothetical protein
MEFFIETVTNASINSEGASTIFLFQVAEWNRFVCTYIPVTGNVLLLHNCVKNISF